MRTTQLQYEIMVDFMETNGDLSKPSSGPRGRNFIAAKWQELANKLNSEGSGDPRSEEKWRKVWSDYKNNCKKKCAKINKAAGGTGGGPALHLTLTDLENRVMQLVGVQAATGMAVQEAGFYSIEVSGCEIGANSTAASEIDWNIPGTSCGRVVSPPSESANPVSPSAPSGPSAPLPPPPSTPLPPPPSTPPAPISNHRGEVSTIPSLEEELWKPPPPKKNKAGLLRSFLDADKNARENAKEREIRYDTMEQERLDLRREELRIREMEVRERVRQRDAELLLQAQWLQFMKEAMDVFRKFVEKKD